MEAPFRTLEQPLVEAVRRVTSDAEALCAVVLPELAAPAGWRDLLHNGRSLHVRWLLLFEPRVVVSSVPFPIGLSAPLAGPGREVRDARG